MDGGNYELCIEDVRDEIWDMVKPADPLRITLADLLSCKQGGTVASMLIDVRGFWAHDNRENLLQEEEEPEEHNVTYLDSDIFYNWAYIRKRIEIALD
ncbi:putative serine/threonine-protein phosphatase 2A regulatory subunit B'' subunit TON2 [Dendrobium catenatum]|uniref:Putative serine/threonine-protein phosphatase 2A regulatory subunit B'' subunit TON2 n=1 Tax=Dendrobium catenatum TaxID=906689 RepID=A0A2I0VDB4_9ASPA|nr:putative serine/threonine-protein phosphatase 2A regulatory subunit B'' subunit TON2 [Dendrobium catenatum]